MQDTTKKRSPKDKAAELVKRLGKGRALIACDTIGDLAELRCFMHRNDNSEVGRDFNYWRQVKTELEKM
jgi:hypothetical protein